LGEGLREAYLVDFLKSPGDSVARDEPLFTMETDKAVSDVECPHAGTLVKWLVEVDSVLEIGTEIAIVDTTVSSRTAGEVPRPHCGKIEIAATPMSIASIEIGDSDVVAGASATVTRLPVEPRKTDALIPPKTRRYLRDHKLTDVVDRISTWGTDRLASKQRLIPVR
jgi:pyruvate dehydrogenase E2 component (dihydrolipoamide acetyltransferase)